MKEAYYFSHDANARQDAKIMALMQKYGWAGYGQFWAIIEMLRSEPGYKLPNKSYSILAFQRMLNDSSTDVQQFINDLINEFELLVQTEEFIYSPSLIRRMYDVDKRREQAKQAGKASAAKRLKNNNFSTTVQQAFNDLPTDIPTTVQQGKEIKGKEIKGKSKGVKPFPPPSLEEVKKYFKDNDYSEIIAERAFRGYSVADWHDTKGNKVKNWKQKMNNVWFTEEHKIDHKNGQSHNNHPNNYSHNEIDLNYNHRK